MRLKVRPSALATFKNSYPRPDLVAFHKPSAIGCNLKREFVLDEKRQHLCKIYRRVRWVDEGRKQKYKDWKIKVLLPHRVGGALVYDYLVVHKLPCKLSELPARLKAGLQVHLNDQVKPDVISYLAWVDAVRGVTVYSQTYYDLQGFRMATKDRYNYEHDSSFYLTQDPSRAKTNAAEGRVPRIDGKYSDFALDEDLGDCTYTPSAEVGKKLDPFYEVFVQLCRPRDQDPIHYAGKLREGAKCVMYDHEDARRHSRAKNQTSLAEAMDNDDYFSSEESDPETSATGHSDASAWDERQLRDIQIDEFTMSRQYRKITCQKTINKQDQSWLVYDWTLGIWPSQPFGQQAKAFQYLMAEMQIVYKAAGPQQRVEYDIDGIRLNISEF